MPGPYCLAVAAGAAGSTGFAVAAAGFAVVGAGFAVAGAAGFAGAGFCVWGAGFAVDVCAAAGATARINAITGPSSHLVIRKLLVATTCHPPPTTYPIPPTS